MSTSLTKEEEKEQKKKKSNINNTLKSSYCHTIETKTKGLSIPLDNRVLESYAKPLEERGKAFKMKHISRLFTLLIANQKNQLNSYLPFEVVAKLLDIKMDKTLKNDMNKFKSQVRKALKELYPTVEFKEDPKKGIKFTHLPKVSNYTTKNKTQGFTQLYCDLDFLKNKDLVVLHTILEYFKGSAKEVYPSIKTIMSLCGCGKRDKINKLLKEGEDMGLWNIISSKGGSSKNTNRYELSYITEDGKERYYYLDLLEEVLQELQVIQEQSVVGEWQ